MGPTNVALVKLFLADQELRQAQARLDAVTRNVRIQERKTNELAEQLSLAQSQLKEHQTHSASLELDLKSREDHIEKLRAQQQNAKNNKEYQAFLLEINTEKADRGKIEDETITAMEAVESGQNQVKELAAQLEAEQAKLAQMRAEINDQTLTLQASIDALRPARDQAWEALPDRARNAFDRMADRFEGEAMGALLKPDPRREEYVCSGCMMDLVVDVYNKLHSRDELLFCPSCHRILYIPDDMPPETAINQKKPVRDRSEKPAKPPRASKKSAGAGESPAAAEAPAAQSPWLSLLMASQGESVKAAIDAGNDAQEFQVIIDDQNQGIFKGKSAENLERIIRFRMSEAGSNAAVRVEPVEAAEAHPAHPAQSV